MASKNIKSKKIKINDISIAYHIKYAKNEDNVILFLHGFPFNKSIWKNQLDSLNDNTTGIAVDIRGHGLTTSGHGFFSIDVFAKDILSFIDSLGYDKVILCGVSMGGYIALKCYEIEPHRISALVLSDTHHKSDDNVAKQKRFDSIQAILRYGRRPFAIAFLENLFSKKTIQSNQTSIDIIKTSIRRNSIRSICSTQLALASRTDSTHVLSEIKVPTLLIRGKEDKLTSFELMNEMHQKIKNSIFKQIDHTGHLPNLESTDEFNMILNDFISNIHQKKSNDC